MSAQLERMVNVYLKIKTKREELSKNFKEADRELVEQQNLIKNALLDHCKSNEVESVRTQSGTFFRTTKTKYWTNNWPEMYKFMIEHGVPEFCVKSLNQSVVTQFLKENPDLMPAGLNAEVQHAISIRKSK